MKDTHSSVPEIGILRVSDEEASTFLVWDENTPPYRQRAVFLF